MVEEVQRLLDSGVSFERCSLFGMEYKQIARFLFKLISYKAMVRDLTQEIHRLAKRQMTYFRGMERRGIPMHWIDRADESMVIDILVKNRF